MKVNQLFELYYAELIKIKRDVDEEIYETKEEIRHISWGISSVYHTMLIHCDDFNTFDLRKANKREKEKFAYMEEGEYSAFDVSLNNHIYKQMNPDLEEIKEGQHYQHKIKPLWILEVGGRKFPIFDDDPGQGYYMRLPNGKIICSSSFCCEPAQEFMYDLIGWLMSTETGLYDDANN